jgi:hypothetical protein
MQDPASELPRIPHRGSLENTHSTHSGEYPLSLPCAANLTYEKRLIA